MVEENAGAEHGRGFRAEGAEAGQAGGETLCTAGSEGSREPGSK